MALFRTPPNRAYADGNFSIPFGGSGIIEEGGALGASLTLVLFFTVLFLTARTMKRDPDDPLVRDLGVSVIAGIAAYALCAAVTETSRMIGTKLAVYTLFAVAFALPRLGRNGVEMGPPTARARGKAGESMATSGLRANPALISCVAGLLLAAASLVILPPYQPMMGTPGSRRSTSDSTMKPLAVSMRMRRILGLFYLATGS
jgi:hypothetical protein